MDAEVLLWTKIAAIGQVVGAFATALAVAVTLWVVLSERQARVKVTAGLRLLVTQGRPDLTEEVINITVVNTGLRRRRRRPNRTSWKTSDSMGPMDRQTVQPVYPDVCRGIGAKCTGHVI